MVMELSVSNEMVRGSPLVLVMYDEGFLSPQYGSLSAIVNLSLLKSKYLLHFVAFSGVASLFLSQVDNRKEEVDNRKVK